MKGCILFGIFFCMIFILSGCATEVKFPEGDEPFLEYQYGNYGPDLFYNLYTKEITFYTDGQAELSTPIDNEIGIDSNAPHTLLFEIESEEMKKLQTEIIKSDFFSLPEDLTDLDVMDGGYKFLTIHTEEESKKVGGGNPDNETLDYLSDQVIKIVPEGILRSFDENIENYQKEQGLHE